MPGRLGRHLPSGGSPVVRDGRPAGAARPGEEGHPPRRLPGRRRQDHRAPPPPEPEGQPRQDRIRGGEEAQPRGGPSPAQDGLPEPGRVRRHRLPPRVRQRFRLSRGPVRRQDPAGGAHRRRRRRIRLLRLLAPVPGQVEQPRRLLPDREGRPEGEIRSPGGRAAGPDPGGLQPDLRSVTATPETVEHAAKKIVVCDDDDTMTDLLDFLLTKEGYSVSVARDGSEAIQLLETVKPNLLLLDL